MSWQTADLLSADRTDVLAADRANVLPADTTHVLPADKFGVGTQHLRIIFEVLDPDLGCLVLETHFLRTCFKSIAFYTFLGAGRNSKADQADQADQADLPDPPEVVRSWQLAP